MNLLHASAAAARGLLVRTSTAGAVLVALVGAPSQSHAQTPLPANPTGTCAFPDPAHRVAVRKPPRQTKATDLKTKRKVENDDPACIGTLPLNDEADPVSQVTIAGGVPYITLSTSEPSSSSFYLSLNSLGAGGSTTIVSNVSPPVINSSPIRTSGKLVINVAPTTVVGFSLQQSQTIVGPTFHQTISGPQLNGAVTYRTITPAARLSTLHR